MDRPLAAISPTISVAWPADRFATSIWLVPGVAPGRPGGSRPARDFEDLEPGAGRPIGDLHQRRLGERGCQEAELHRVASRAGVAPAAADRPVDVDPATLASAGGDGVTDEHLVVAVGEGGVRRSLRRMSGDHVRVDGSEQGAERVGEALDMAGRQGGRGPPGDAHQGRVSEQDLVRPVAVPEPQVIGRLGIPCGRAGRAVDFPLQGVLPAGADLRDGQRAAGTVREAEQDGRDVLGRHLARQRIQCRAPSRRSRPAPVARRGPG